MASAVHFHHSTCSGGASSEPRCTTVYKGFHICPPPSHFTRPLCPLSQHRKGQACRIKAAAFVKSRPAPTTSSVQQDGKTLSFLDWARAAGINFPNLAPANFNGLRGMSATSDVKADDLIISVPREVAITLAPKQKCPFPELIDAAFWAKAPWFVKMGLMLLHQKQQGPKGRLSSYLEQLPSVTGVPVLWDHSQLQLLQYPYLIHQVKEQQLNWDMLYADLQAALKPGMVISKQEFLWALSVIRSRTFSGPYIGSTLKDRFKLAGLVAVLVVGQSTLGSGDVQKTLTAAIAVFVFNILYEVILSQSLKQYALCPLIDFINHTSKEQSEVSYDYFQDRYSVVATRDYAKGEQVFISYGKQSNDSLMQYYGFAESDNPEDVYVMTNLLKWVELSVGPLCQKRLDALNKSSLLTSLQLVTIARNGLPSETLQALRYLLATDTEAAAGVDSFKAAASEETEGKLAKLLVHCCECELKSLGTSIADDTQLLASRALSGTVESAAVQFRLEKKKVLVACLASLGADTKQHLSAAVVPSKKTKGF